MLTPGIRLRLGLILIFVLVFSACAPHAFCGDTRGLLWKVKSRTNTVYLLGSIHFFKKEFYPLPKTIEDAFHESEILAVEANIVDVRQIDLQNLLEKALYIDESTLESHVSRDTFELLRRKVQDLGLPLELFLKQKPWFIALMLTSVELLKLGLEPQYGIDQHFLSMAEGKKRIVELESLNDQIRLLSEMSDRDQESFLLLSLRDSATQSREVNGLLRAWTSGDAKEIETLLTQNARGDRASSSMFEILFTDRNRKMASRVEGLLKTRETYFVIVGAGHLVGENGIVELLRKKGYQVEPM